MNRNNILEFLEIYKIWMNYVGKSYQVTEGYLSILMKWILIIKEGS